MWKEREKNLQIWKRELNLQRDNAITKLLTEALRPGSSRVQRSRRFYNAINKQRGSIALIAELKRKSPSKGHIGHIPNPALLSRAYRQGGAAAISVLTDREGFGGSMADLKQVVDEQESYHGSEYGPCPVLRKEFIIDHDPLQIAEAAVSGASAVLLIVVVLGEQTREFINHAHTMGLDALVEVHDEMELKIAVDAGAEIIGIS